LHLLETGDNVLGYQFNYFFPSRLATKFLKSFFVERIKPKKTAMSWPKISRVEIGSISEFLSNFESIGLTEEIKIVTIQLRKSTGLKIPDAVIAATALTQAVPLLTNNLKDFEKVDFLKIFDPMNLG
jgi:predicted nucleic acid-binding protein